MSDVSHIDNPTDADIAASFAQQLRQRPPGQADDTPSVDPEPQIQETETEHAPDVEAEEAPSSEEFAETDAEPASDPETGHPEPTIQPPLGMTAEDAATFAQADPTLQAWLVQREAQRTAGFTQKTEQLSRQRSDLEAQQAEVARQRDQYAQILQGLVQTELKPPPASLYDDNPDEYGRQRAIYEQNKDQRDAAMREWDRVQKEQTAEIERQLKAHEDAVKAEMPRLIPAMADPKKADAIEAELRAYATARGIPENGYKRATAGEKAILWKAMMFDKGQGAKPARKAPPKAQRPGSARQPATGQRAAAANIKQAAQRTEETGDLRHIYAARLKAEGKK